MRTLFIICLLGWCCNSQSAFAALKQPATTNASVYKSNHSSTDVNADKRIIRRPSASSRDKKKSEPFSLFRSKSKTSQSNSTGSSRLLSDSIGTTIAATVFVIGLFFMGAWLVKRGMPKSKTELPKDVISVLGRVSLGEKQFAQMLRVGNKLVLVSVTPHGMETLTEVTDPIEVNRLLGLCEHQSSNSTSASFQDVLQQLASEKTPPNFFGNDAGHSKMAGGTSRG